MYASHLRILMIFTSGFQNLNVDKFMRIMVVPQE